MNNLRNLTFTLLIFISSIFNPYSTQAQTLINVTPANLTEVVSDIYATYGAQIEIAPAQLQNFIQSFIPANGLGACSACFPHIQEENANSITFEWNSIGFADAYRLGRIDLKNSQSNYFTTPETKATINNLAPNLHMFVFQTKCAAEDVIVSTINLIIVDKAILQDLVEGDCNCNNKTEISYNGPTSINSVSIPWNSNCEYTKYKIEIEGTLNGSPFTSCLMVIHDATGSSGNGLDNVYVLPNCNINVSYGPGSFVGYEEYYGVTFTTWGMIFYLIPSPPLSFSIDKINIRNCNCKFIDRPGERISMSPLASSREEPNQKGEMRVAESLDYSAFPNPVKDFTTIKYALKEATVINIAIHDTTGKILQSFAKNKQDVGEYTQKIDLSSYPNGIYHVVVQYGYGDQYKALQVVKQ